MADVAADLKTWSATASSNSPAGSTAVGTGLDDNLREIQKVVRQDLANKGADIIAATTTDLGAVPGSMHDITGTTTITGFGTVSAGITKIVKFEGALTLTHNATSLILPGAANITTADGDIGIFISEGSGNWRCVSYVRASGLPLVTSPILNTATNALSADVNLSNTGSYFDGPSMAQGTAGTWLATGTVTVFDSAGGAVYYVKLWDGTTVIATGVTQHAGAGQFASCTLSGYLASPAGNIRISVRDSTSTSGKIIYNQTSLSKDSNISGIRIA